MIVIIFNLEVVKFWHLTSRHRLRSGWYTTPFRRRFPARMSSRSLISGWRPLDQEPDTEGQRSPDHHYRSVWVRGASRGIPDPHPRGVCRLLPGYRRWCCSRFQQSWWCRPGLVSLGQEGHQWCLGVAVVESRRPVSRPDKRWTWLP